MRMHLGLACGNSGVRAISAQVRLSVSAYAFGVTA